MRKDMKRILLIFLCVSGLLFAGCATFPDKSEEENSSLTAGNVKATIVKGETTQADILEAFGSPNLVTRNRDGQEVWNYNRMNYTTRRGSDDVGLIFYGGSRAVTTSTTKSFDLMITFDENDVVIDYTVIQASF
jgi:hypothetical protein